MKRILILLFFPLLTQIAYGSSQQELPTKKVGQFLHLLENIKNNVAHQHKLEIILRMTSLGKRMLHSYNLLSQGKTGFRSLDALNEQLGTRIVTYEQGCLHLACEHSLPSHQIALIFDAYNNLPGTGKLWSIEENTTFYSPKKKPKKILVQLNSHASHDFILNQAHIHCEDGIKETGIQSLDILNHNYEGTIIDTLRIGKHKNVGLTIEFAHPLSDAILDEYRNLPEIAKVESISA